MTTIVSVSWVSFNNDPYEREKNGSYLKRDGGVSPGPTLELLFNPASPIAGKVKKHYMLVRRPRQPEPFARQVQPTEAEVAEELKKAIKEIEGAPDVEIKWWGTDAPPTDHRELFIFTARTLAQIRQENPRAKIFVNLSPGTPAAQTVMLLALQARLAGENVQAVQGAPRDRRRDPDDVVREVPWNLLAELAATDTEIDDARNRPTVWSLDRARSRELRKVAEQIDKYSGVPFPVLIVGARGTGKTEVARKLRDGFLGWKLKEVKPWKFHLNCAEFRGDPGMLRSNLFGYLKGSHSTAVDNVEGLLESAADDCVFLDEIHWLDPVAQGMLLVALQRNGSIRRIGGAADISTKFRLIAATNQPRHILREKLTPDFLDRISDLVVELPELRDCREDIGDIWKSVARRACEELVQHDPSRAQGSGKGGGRIDDLVTEFWPHQVKIERALCELRLPGNFRDLERLARRLLVGGLAKGRFLSLKEELVRSELDRLRKEERADSAQNDGPAITLTDELPTMARCEDYLRAIKDAGGVLAGPRMVDVWERRLLTAAQAVAGSGTRAAELLGMNSRTFNAKMKRYDIALAKDVDDYQSPDR